MLSSTVRFIISKYKNTIFKDKTSQNLLNKSYNTSYNWDLYDIKHALVYYYTRILYKLTALFKVWKSTFYVTTKLITVKEIHLDKDRIKSYVFPCTVYEPYTRCAHYRIQLYC